MTVRVYRSTDFGAPANVVGSGTLVNLLRKCLVDGYGSQTVTITSAGTVATITTPAAHGLKNGTRVLISGADQAGYNGEAAVTATGLYTYTVDVAAELVTPATGTILAKVAGSGWTAPFASADGFTAAFRQGAGSNGRYLRVEDTSNTSNSIPVNMYESMTDVDFGVGKTPATGSYKYFFKGSAAAPGRPWWLIATEKIFYFFTAGQVPSYLILSGFGDIDSYKSGDVYNTLLLASVSESDSSHVSITPTAGTSGQGVHILRAHTQIASQTKVGFFGVSGSGYLGAAGISYPALIDGGLHIQPIYISEDAAGLRGRVLGLWNPLHNKPFSHADEWDGTGEFAGKKFIAMTFGWGANQQVFVEISNTW